MSDVEIVETNAAQTVRLVREDGVYAIQRQAVDRWFTVLRDPRPFFADNRYDVSPLDAALGAYRDICRTA